MTPSEVTTILRQFNAWRRDLDDKIEQPDTREISEAIDAAVEMIDRLEAAESDALEQARLNGMGASREAALMAKLEAAEKDIAHIKEVEFPRKVRAVAVGWEKKCARLEQERDNANAAAAGVALQAETLQAERDALQAKVEEKEKQEPVAWCATDETGTVIEALGMNQSRRFDTALYLVHGARGDV